MTSYNERYLELLVRKGTISDVKEYIVRQKLWAERQLERRGDDHSSLAHFSIYSAELSRCLRALQTLEDDINAQFSEYEGA